MKIRYAVWVEVPQKIGLISKVKTPHLSILWPFFLNTGVTEKNILEKVRNILFESFEARLSKLSVWEQKDKKILVVEVEPKEKFQKIFGEVLLALRSDIVFDKSVFSEGLLPNFLPHITIDYDFNGDVSKLDKQELIKCFFAVDKMGLYREEERGRWIKCE
ncbi:MAG: hypothetical protein UU09_C0032G0015 [Microgenomates group bacterium GW2011_GWA2_40_6]|nr:MAG: hypothetical protein UU09_C0032G0015 [Microgenomates group bacterium GW2011_GWA2_40_6]